MGYNTVSIFLPKYATRLKPWAIPFAVIAFVPFIAAYYYLCPDFPQITNLGFYLSSIFIGMWLWADTEGEEQKHLLKESDFEQLSAIYFRELDEMETLPNKEELSRHHSEPRSDVDVRFLGYKYPDCNKSLLRLAKGEIEFPGAYIIIPTALQDKISLIMKARKGEPQMPHIYCDGSKNAIMTYDNERTIGLCSLGKGAQRVLSNYESIRVYEVVISEHGEKLVRSYSAPVTYVAPQGESSSLFGSEPKIEER